jgi:pimeloyl-ACP methyl ester carboxylesterase
MKRRLLLLGSLIFIAGNVVAFMHAWRFTHFTDEGGMHSPNPEQLTPSHKLWVLLTGVRNPKPQNLLAPSFAVQNITIASPNGPLAAWYARPDTAAPRGTVALFHGYTGSKAHLLHEAGYFRHLGYAVLLVDQTGNGNSAGSRTTIGYREADDVAAAVHYLRARQPAASPDSLILYGVSMGAVAIMRAEAELGVRADANILECPYGTMRQTVYNRFHSMNVPAFPLADMLVFWGGVQNGFWAYNLQGEEFARRIKTPTLLLWGTADPRVTRAETDAIFANLAGPKQRLDFDGSGHEPYWLKHPEAWQEVVAGFMKEHQTRP